MAAFAGQWWTNNQSVFSNCEIWELMSLTREHGNDPSTAMSEFRHLNDELLSHSGRLSWGNHIEIMRLLVKANNGNLPSGFAHRLHLKTYGPPGFAILTSPTLEKAIETIIRFAVLLNINFPLEFTPDGLIRLHMSNSGHIDPNLAMLLFELDIFKLHNFIDDVMSPKFIKKSLSICGHDSNLKDYRNLINNFWHNDKISSITADIKISINKLSSPLPGSSVEIHRRYVEESDLTLVNLLKNIDIKLAIIKRLQNLEFGMPTMSEISSDLNMSERTLRRKLIKLNTSFSELRDHVRSNLAKELLIDSNHSTEDVAERLGYSDAANFRHAFKRWHGEPPSFFRKKMTSAKLWTAPQGNFRSGAILDSSDTSRSERR